MRAQSLAELITEHIKNNDDHGKTLKATAEGFRWFEVGNQNRIVFTNLKDADEADADEADAVRYAIEFNNPTAEGSIFLAWQLRNIDLSKYVIGNDPAAESAEVTILARSNTQPETKG